MRTLVISPDMLDYVSANGEGQGDLQKERGRGTLLDTLIFKDKRQSCSAKQSFRRDHKGAMGWRHLQSASIEG